VAGPVEPLGGLPQYRMVADELGQLHGIGAVAVVGDPAP
jgi:hypothetical protein